jgi:hypothetical protein
MSEIEITLEQMRGLIGIRVSYRGDQYEVIEVLEDGPSVVLRQLGEQRVIQSNYHGNPHRRVQETLMVPVLAPDRRALHSEFLLLELIDMP